MSDDLFSKFAFNCVFHTVNTEIILWATLIGKLGELR